MAPKDANRQPPLFGATPSTPHEAALYPSGVARLRGQSKPKYSVSPSTRVVLEPLTFTLPRHKASPLHPWTGTLPLTMSNGASPHWTSPSEPLTFQSCRPASIALTIGLPSLIGSGSPTSCAQPLVTVDSLSNAGVVCAALLTFGVEQVLCLYLPQYPYSQLVVEEESPASWYERKQQKSQVQGTADFTLLCACPDRFMRICCLCLE